MSRISMLRLVGQCVLAAACLAGGHAMAQSEPSLAEVYAAVKAGKLEQAQVMVQQVLIAHPNSAKAYFVRSEVFARQGDLKRAREALASAETLAPGLAFAKAEAVQALRAQLSASPARPAFAGSAVRQAAAPVSAPASSWGLPLALAGGVLVVGYFVFRRRPAQVVAPQPVYPPGGGLASPEALGVGGGAGVVPPGFGQASASGMGGRIMGGVATGLAVGAGVLAAEAIGRNLMGHHDTASGSPALTADDARADTDAGASFNRNADMGGQNFGVTDAGGWDDAGSLDVGGGDWDS